MPVARVPGEVVGEGGGGTEDAEQPVAQRLGRDQGVEEFPLGDVTVLRLYELARAEQCEIGIGGGAERVEEHRIGPYGLELRAVQEPLGGRRIGEAVSYSSRVKVLLLRPGAIILGPPVIRSHDRSDQGRTSLSLTPVPAVAPRAGIGFRRRCA